MWITAIHPKQSYIINANHTLRAARLLKAYIYGQTKHSHRLWLEYILTSFKFNTYQTLEQAKGFIRSPIIIEPRKVVRKREKLAKKHQKEQERLILYHKIMNQLIPKLLFIRDNLKSGTWYIADEYEYAFMQYSGDVFLQVRRRKQ